ncbi:SDR family NAD(P)-dependent oxidoreductase [Streptomyces netropsis]|uniref:NAD(P)-dependent dehydrogenase (Short-subunit alcohol dehydrogenase family) n=1 Tax=Streptomyces netropsis TaxID=55404 RepID=A0A7W7PDY3_STRNE|nr:SDR family oxidoreductase [Streptomyces netropsis]MBB4887286.1 NAD(P)-dependent dehydrogenase (short-subunit alcohol dehydrogenase family) [Streptomyces netropsis]GGR09216.1 3-oxoacyl-ACP reductase [Streptomyces netropsis]
MLLENKVAVIYGAGGRIGRAVARTFAREGAEVFLAGRTRATLDDVADEIRSAGGTAVTTRLDARDEKDVNAFVDGVAGRAGRVDISFNLIGYGAARKLPKPSAGLSAAEFARPVPTAATWSHFLTTGAAARHMAVRGSGVILALGGPSPTSAAGPGGFDVALDALEGLRRQWATQLDRYGIRVVTLKTGDGDAIASIGETGAGEAGRGDAGVEETQPLSLTATPADIAAAATLVASDRARAMASATVNVSCGALVDL